MPRNLKTCHSCHASFEGDGQTCGKSECALKWESECAAFSARIFAAKPRPWRESIKKHLNAYGKG